MTGETTAMLAGHMALVTGASSGIGRATARRLAQAGATVIAMGRDEGRLEAVRAELGASGETTVADLAQPTKLAQAMAGVTYRHGRLDILVINAGVSNAPDITDLDLQSYDRLMDVNVRGAVFTFVNALPFLADGASVVFVGSGAERKGQPGDALYAGSKGFIRAFARNAGTSPELMARRIRMNVVSPGPVETPLTVAATNNSEIRSYVEGLIRCGVGEGRRK